MKHALQTSAPLRLRARGGPARHAADSAAADRSLIGVIVALLAGAALITAALWPSAPPSSAATAAPTTLSEQQLWQQRLSALYDVRAEAFDTGEVALLRQVYTVDSRQLSADLDTIESLLAQQRTVSGFAPKILAVESIAHTPDGVVVAVRDEIEPFVIVDATGTEMPVTGRDAALTTFTLREVDGTWLIASAEREG